MRQLYKDEYDIRLSYYKIFFEKCKNQEEIIP